MADLTDRIPQNVPGRFYLDSTCTDCDLCREMAPAFFRRDDDIGQTYVYHQPETDEEVRQATEALQCCPTESIGDEEA